MGTNNFTVRPGDIFRDKDPRMEGRHLKVVSADSRYAYVINCAPDGGRATGRKTRISLRGLETRFEKVGGSTQVADLERAVLSAAEKWHEADAALEKTLADNSYRVFFAGDNNEVRRHVNALDTLRNAVADLRRARDVKEGEG